MADGIFLDQIREWLERQAIAPGPPTPPRQGMMGPGAAGWIPTQAPPPLAPSEAAPVAPAGEYRLPQPPPPAGLELGPGGAAPSLSETLQETYGGPVGAVGEFLGDVGHAVADPLVETARGLSAREITRGNPQEFLDQLARQREANTARIQGIEAARASPDLTLPVSPEEGEYRLPQPTPQDQLDILEAIRSGEKPGAPEETGAEAVATAAADEADTDAGRIQVERPGDLARARAEEKIARLTAFRDIAEGLGTVIPVKGEITQRVMPEPFEAKGIQDAIDRAEAEDMLRLKEQIGFEGKAELQKRGAGYALERVEAQEKIAQQAAEIAHTRMMERQKVAEEQRQLGRKGLLELNTKLKGTLIKPFTDATIGRLTAMTQLGTELTKVLRDKHKYNTGPVINTFENIIQTFTGEFFIGAEKLAFKSTLNNILAWYVRSVEGGRPSDKDREFLKTVAPHAGDDDQQLILKAQNLLAWSRRNKAEVERLLREGKSILGPSSILDGAIPFSSLNPEQQVEGWSPDVVTIQIPGEDPREVLRDSLDVELFMLENPNATITE